jgi:hypothetical protein
MKFTDSTRDRLVSSKVYINMVGKSALAARRLFVRLVTAEDKFLKSCLKDSAVNIADLLFDSTMSVTCQVSE